MEVHWPSCSNHQDVASALGTGDVSLGSESVDAACFSTFLVSKLCGGGAHHGACHLYCSRKLPVKNNFRVAYVHTVDDRETTTH
jgi:hypothetical protein